MNSLPKNLNVASRMVPILAGAFLLSMPPESVARSPQEVFSLSVGSVAPLEVLDAAGQLIGSHSATRIDERRFVSVCDVLENAQTIRISLKPAPLDGKVVARDRQRNLCLIEVSSPSASGFSIQRQAPAAGSRVFAISNALGLGIGISEGVVSGIRHFSGENFIQFTAPISPGSEGGALVDDEGRLIGIIEYRQRNGQNVNFATPAGRIEEIEQRSAASAEQLKRFDDAMALLKQEQWTALSRFSADWLRRHPDDPGALRFSIAAAKGLKDAEGELIAWRNLRKRDPGQAEIGIGLGRALLASRRIKEALELGKQLVSEHPEYANAWWLLARAQQLSGTPQDAAASYRRATELDPWLVDAYHGLAILAEANGDHATAISIWSRLSGLYPDVPAMRTGLAHAYIAAGKPARAYAVLERLPGKEKDSAAAWYGRAVALYRLDRPDAAVQAYRRSLDLKLENTDWALAGIGFAMAKMERFPEAIAAFEGAVKANPDNDDWRYQLAVTLKDGGRPAEALKITTALTQKAPEVARNWRQHGFVLAVWGKPLDAIGPMERSLQLDPKQPKLWGALIEANQVADRRVEAVNAYQKLREIDANTAESIYRAYLLPYEDNAR